MEEKIKYLEMIQNIIQRMTNNSFLMKGWTVTLIVAVFVLSDKAMNPNYFWIAYVPVIVFWFLDSYYLLLERRYIFLYNEVRNRDEKIDSISAKKRKDYDFKSQEEKYESLFCDTKSNGKLPKECMYKTSAYMSIMTQRCAFIIGRKGSGKTTFFEILEKYEENGRNSFDSQYKVLKPISAECIDVFQMYSVLEKYKEDRRIFSVSKWRSYFGIYIFISARYILFVLRRKAIKY